MNSLEGEEDEQRLGLGIVGCQDLADSLCVEMGGVFTPLTPRDRLALVEVEATPPGAVTGVVGVVVHTARQGAKVRVEATASGQALLLVEAQVPLADHVGGVAELLQSLGEGDLVEGQAVGLTGTDDGVLQAGVNLVPVGLMISKTVRRTNVLSIIRSNRWLDNYTQKDGSRRRGETVPISSLSFMCG